MTLLPGSRLGPYEILAALGAGGMGEVYKASDNRLGRDVAIKVLPERLAGDSEALSRFEREAKAVAALSHPNILAIHDFGREGGFAYAVTELLEGETLRERLSSGPLSLRSVLEYGGQIARGLAAAHGKGIVHRDIKPDNIFIANDECVKILDFGLAKPSAALAKDDTRSPTVSAYTEPGTVMGTVGYMSPEQVRGLAVDWRSDIFSFGAVLYEMATGRRAFQRDTPAETMTAILREEPPEVSGTGRPIAPAVDRIIRRCLEKKPEQRFQSAQDLAFALSWPPSTGAGVETATTAPAHGPARAIGIGIAAVLAAAAIVGYLLLRGGESPSKLDWSEATSTPLTIDPGYEGEPTFSPDGQTIAYVADRDGNFEIYLEQISGGPALNLTRNPAADIQPAFSPDGREIAFVSDRSGSSEVIHAAPGLPLVGGDIWIMPALGGPARRILESGNCPSWTPDGSALLYVHGTFRNTRIARVPATGGESRDLSIDESDIARYFYPSLSGDGRWLLYQNGDRIEIVSSRGGKPRVLAQGEEPAWGPGSTSILFTNDAPGKGRTLWQAPVSLARGEFTGPPSPLTFGRGADLGARASRDGMAIAFAAVDDSLNLEELPFDAEAGRATGRPREVTRGNNHIAFFDASPDGKAIVFAAQRGVGSHLWRIDPPAPAVQLTLDPGYWEGDPEWSPDGRQIAFTRGAAGRSQGSAALWLMNADGTNPHRVTDMSGQKAWLPNGNQMIIQRGDSLLRLDLASGAATPIAGAQARTLFAVDVQGKWIAFQTVEHGAVAIAAIPVAGGVPRIVVQVAYGAYHPSFSPSGRWLYFQINHKNLFRVPGPALGWKSTAPERVTNFSGGDLYLEDPRISVDGRTLFYTRGLRTGDIYLLRAAR
jgi:eukaryotic-like serine/threonine-protein kinase